MNCFAYLLNIQLLSIISVKIIIIETLLIFAFKTAIYPTRCVILHPKYSTLSCKNSEFHTANNFIVIILIHTFVPISHILGK